MGMSLTKEDRTELIEALRVVEKNLSSWTDGGFSTDSAERCRQALLTFHTTAAMLDQQELGEAGEVLAKYFEARLTSSSEAESLTVFGFALDMVLQSMRLEEESAGPSLNVAEIKELLDVSSAGDDPSKEEREESREEEAAFSEAFEKGSPETEAFSEGEGLEISRFREMVEALGGRLTPCEGDKAGAFELHFDALTPDQIKGILFSVDPGAVLSSLVGRGEVPEGSGLQDILCLLKEFMETLVEGNLSRSEEILVHLAEHRQQAKIYEEIGNLARELHDSIKSFASTMDEAFKEMVEDRIPDSGSRLEHIMELTENAATITLNHVEAMQERNKHEEEDLARLESILDGLNAVGETAFKKLGESRAVMERLKEYVAGNHQDLITVLTAQDYQDLTGQVIMKIIKILKDLEFKLVDLVRTFGARFEKGKMAEVKESDELYGPAYKGKEGTLQSQDDVDGLLAEFGF